VRHQALAMLLLSVQRRLPLMAPHPVLVLLQALLFQSMPPPAVRLAQERLLALVQPMLLHSVTPLGQALRPL